MDIQQMHIEFRQSLDKVDSSAYPDLLTEQVDYFLNESITRYVKTMYSGNNFFQAGFEVIQKRTEDLKTLVKTEFPTVTLVAEEEDTYKASLSSLYLDEALTTLSVDNYWFYLRSRARLVKAGCTSTYVGVVIYKHNDLNEVLHNPFKKPSTQELVGYYENDYLYIVVPTGFTLDRVKLTFLKKPIEVKYGTIYPIPVADIDCDLPEHTHKEIIQLATVVALENLEAQRLQTSMGMKQTIE